MGLASGFEEQRKRAHTVNPIVAYLVKNKIPLTVQNYVECNWMGEKTVEDLEGEEIAEIEELLEEGQLVDTQSSQASTKGRRVQSRRSAAVVV